MDQPGDFYSEPFDISGGGIFSVEASAFRPARHGPIEYFLDGSEDRTCWVGVLAGSVSDGQRVEIPCQSQQTRWGRVHLRSFGGDARVNVRWFGKGRK